MGLLSFMSRKEAAATPAPDDAVEQARTRARRRLVGAVVLVGIGVVGFPLLFETQPRPIPVNVTIEIPRKDAVAPLVPPAAADAASTTRRDASAAVEKGEVPSTKAAPSEAPVKSAARATAAPASRAPAAERAPGTPPAVKGDDAGRTKVVQANDASRKAEPAKSAAGTDAPRPAEPKASQDADPTRKTDAARIAAAPRESAPARAASSPAAPRRAVVQVGSFADANVARELRQRVEQLGFKTHVQVAETDKGTRLRVRVGPFATREEAEQAAARLKAAGVTAAVMGR